MYTCSMENLILSKFSFVQKVFFQQCMLLYVRSDKKRGDNFQSSVSHSHKLVDYCSSQLTADLHIVLLKNDSCIYQQNVYICVFERFFFMYY